MASPFLQRTHLPCSTQSSTLLQNQSPDVVCPDVSPSFPPDGSRKGGMQCPPGAGCAQQQLCCPYTAASSATSPKAYRYISHASTGDKLGLIKPRWTLLVVQCHSARQGRKSSSCLCVAGTEMACVSPCESHCSAFSVSFPTLVSSALLQEFFDFTSVQFCTSPVIRKYSKPIMAKIDSPSEQGSTSLPSPHEAVWPTSSPSSPLTSPPQCTVSSPGSHTHHLPVSKPTSWLQWRGLSSLIPS